LKAYASSAVDWEINDTRHDTSLDLFWFSFGSFRQAEGVRNAKLYVRQV